MFISAVEADVVPSGALRFQSGAGFVVMVSWERLVNAACDCFFMHFSAPPSIKVVFTTGLVEDL